MKLGRMKKYRLLPLEERVFQWWPDKPLPDELRRLAEIGLIEVYGESKYNGPGYVKIVNNRCVHKCEPGDYIAIDEFGYIKVHSKTHFSKRFERHEQSLNS